MHYKDGQVAKLGDMAKFSVCTVYRENKPEYSEYTGVVVQIVPGSTSCNAAIIYTRFDLNAGVPLLQGATVTLSECSLVHRADPYNP